MPRAARIASAIFVNVLVGIPLVMLARAETAPVDTCLSSPKNETPAGSHWYYRIDHVNKRNCWYLRQEGGGVAQAVPQAERTCTGARTTAHRQAVILRRPRRTPAASHRARGQYRKQPSGQCPRQQCQCRKYHCYRFGRRLRVEFAKCDRSRSHALAGIVARNLRAQGRSGHHRRCDQQCGPTFDGGNGRGVIDGVRCRFACAY